MLGNQYDAEDVVHALFVELINKGRQEADLPYLYRAVTNRCINILRKQKNHRQLLERQQASIAAPPRSTIDEKTISLDLLTKLAGRLDKKSFAILVYRFLDDLTQEEISQLVGLSRISIHKRLQKINRLAVELAETRAAGEDR